VRQQCAPHNQVLWPSGGAFHLDQLVEGQAPNGPAEEVQVDRVGKGLGVAPAAGDLTQQVERTEVRGQGEVEPIAEGGGGGANGSPGGASRSDA